MSMLGSKTFRQFLAIAGTATLTLAACYTMVQQSSRLTADDAPLALAQTMKLQLESGAQPNDVVPAQTVNLKNNSNTFAIVTDKDQHVLASSALLDAQSPLPPKGVFQFTTIHGSDHFTLEPTAGVRLATRVVSYGSGDNSGYIVTGQSLAQVEDRIDTYGLLALAAWLAVVAWTFLVLVLPERRFSKK